jgi:hypothetical protein
VDRHGVAGQPHGRDGSARHESGEQPQRDPVGEAARSEEVQDRSPDFSVITEYTSAIVKMTTMSPSESHFGISNAT